MGHPTPDEEAHRTRLAQTIQETVGLSKRPAAIWLRTYADTLRDPQATVERWDALLREEERELARFPERTDRKVVRDLFRWHADTLRRLDQQEAFRQVIQRTLDLIEGEFTELFDFVDWALEREAWTVVDEVANRYSTEFFKHAILVYRLAEAQLKRGEEALAEATAQRALAIDPDTPESHTQLGRYLVERSLYPWAEAEYRHVIAKTTPSPNDNLNLEARFNLAEMLFDLQQYAEAADVIGGVVAAIDQNAKVLQPFPNVADEVRGTLHYYQAMACAARGEHTRQVEHLRQAIELYATNPDILIAMYRVPEADEAFRQDTLQRIQLYQGMLRSEIQAAEQAIKNPGNEAARLENMENAANRSNELAWLIANTQGDFEAALRHSRRSLELKPDNPAYLDTLARCHYALQDYANAVKHQTQAVERAPWYQQMRRQLELFKKALDQQTASQ
jgi:tetratricopeptide (TPR) repeat protein